MSITTVTLHKYKKGMVIDMLPLTVADAGETHVIKKIGGSPEVKKHLENLGFVVGGTVTVVAATGGNLIVSVKEARVAVGKDLAAKVMV